MLSNPIRKLFYWKGLVTQADMFVNMCNNFQHFNNRKTLYGSLPPKINAELKPWELVYIIMIGIDANSIIQKQIGVSIIQKYISLAFI